MLPTADLPHTRLPPPNPCLFHSYNPHHNPYHLSDTRTHPLTPSPLPYRSAEVAAATLPLLEMAYSWLFSAARYVVGVVMVMEITHEHLL